MGVAGKADRVTISGLKGHKQAFQFIGRDSLRAISGLPISDMMAVHLLMMTLTSSEDLCFWRASKTRSLLRQSCRR